MREKVYKPHANKISAFSTNLKQEQNQTWSKKLSIGFLSEGKLKTFGIN